MDVRKETDAANPAKPPTTDKDMDKDTERTILIMTRPQGPNPEEATENPPFQTHDTGFDLNGAYCS
jgi:hypothetical protein